MTRFSVRHMTHYAYEAPTAESHNIARLVPRSLPTQEVLARSVRIRPEPAALFEHEDFHGNRVIYFSHEEAHSELEIVAESEVRLGDSAEARSRADGALPLDHYAAWLAGASDAEAVAGRPMRLRSPLVRALAAARAYAAPSFHPDRPVLESALELNSRIHADFAFDPDATDVGTPLAEVFQKRAGVCQDFAHVALACLRSFGLAARYVSGYVETDPPPGGPKLVGVDASHAWIAALLPGADGGPGVWIDFDPTNNLLPGDRHITLAWGRDYADVAPLKGVVLGGGGHSLSLGVAVERLTG